MTKQEMLDGMEQARAEGRYEDIAALWEQGREFDGTYTSEEMDVVDACMGAARFVRFAESSRPGARATQAA